MAEVRIEPIDRVGLAVLASAKLVFHLLTHRGYGIFRDEFYYIACAAHPSWGYVDHPPFSVWLLWLQTSLFGDSLLALRLLPALAGAGAVLVAGLLARDLGGGHSAQRLAAAAAFCSPYLLATSHFYSMNVFEWLFVSLLALIAIRILGRGLRHGWIWFGAVAGLALLNKLLVGVFAAGLVAGLLFGAERRELLRSGIYLGGGLAVLIFLPHVVWQVANDWPTLDFMARASAEKNFPITPLGLLAGQVTLVGPLAMLLAVCGLLSLLRCESLRPARALGWGFLISFAVFAAAGAKVYYLTPHFAVPVAAGCVVFERWALGSGRGWCLGAAASVMFVVAVIVLPVAVPVLPEESLVAWMKTLGVEQPRTELNERGALPQIYADMHGWEELTDQVEAVVATLASAERGGAVIFAGNYGEAGAIQYFGRGRELPPVASPHNSYWLWGSAGWTGATVISVGIRPERAAEWFEDVEDHGTLECEWCVPYEKRAHILVLRKPRVAPEEIWRRMRRFI
ncbi:MAG: glycosyltransferase family 39 protein [bacterium]|nr:glycosyltransferase family 39 protein [bacterium]